MPVGAERMRVRRRPAFAPNVRGSERIDEVIRDRFGIYYISKSSIAAITPIMTALNELALAEVRSPPRSISISLFRIRRVAISHPWRVIKASREVAGQVPPSIRRPGRRSSSDEVEFSFGQLASVVHGVHCDLPSTGEWPIQSPCEHIGSALAADPVNPFTDSAQIRHFVMAITRILSSVTGITALQEIIVKSQRWPKSEFRSAVNGSSPLIRAAPRFHHRSAFPARAGLPPEAQSTASVRSPAVALAPEQAWGRRRQDIAQR